MPADGTGGGLATDLNWVLTGNMSDDGSGSGWGGNGFTAGFNAYITQVETQTAVNNFWSTVESSSSGAIITNVDGKFISSDDGTKSGAGSLVGLIPLDAQLTGVDKKAGMASFKSMSMGGLAGRYSVINLMRMLVVVTVLRMMKEEMGIKMLI